MAETTTILFFAGSSIISLAAFLIRSADPTQVPPNLRARGHLDLIIQRLPHNARLPERPAPRVMYIKTASALVNLPGRPAREAALVASGRGAGAGTGLRDRGAGDGLSPGSNDAAGALLSQRH